MEINIKKQFRGRGKVPVSTGCPGTARAHCGASSFINLLLQSQRAWECGDIFPFGHINQGRGIVLDPRLLDKQTNKQTKLYF